MSMCVFTLSIESITLDASFMEARKRDFLTSTCLPSTSKTETKELPKENENYIEKSTTHMSRSCHKWRAAQSRYADKFSDGFCKVRLKLKRRRRRKKLKCSSIAAVVDHKRIISDFQQNVNDNFIDTVFGLLET